MATTARNKVSLERALSKLGLASRSEARALIASGRVSIGGKTVTDSTRRVTPESIAITIDGRVPRRATESITIALHKPRGYVTTRSDPEGRKTVYDLLTDLSERVVPVGRLDLATSGLLILTNDTQLADWLTDPRNALPRVYLVTAEGRVTDAHLAILERGVRHDAEQLRAASAELPEGLEQRKPPDDDADRGQESRGAPPARNDRTPRDAITPHPVRRARPWRSAFRTMAADQRCRTARRFSRLRPQEARAKSEIEHQRRHVGGSEHDGAGGNTRIRS